MALIKLVDEAKARIVSPEQAAEIWRILNDEATGSEVQQAYVTRVQKIYMDWKHPATPQSYLQFYKDTLTEKARDQGVTLEALPHTEYNPDHVKNQYGEEI